ncbi:MAG: hypothetical protein WAN83_02705 [Candidatus Dormiibacterota bacterium]
MVARQVVPVRAGEEDRAFATLVLAFAADPVERWLYPEAHQYLTSFPTFLSAFGGKAFAEKTVWRLGAFSAVALWLPPNVDLDSNAIVAVLTATVAPERHDDTFAVLGQMDNRVRRHWRGPGGGLPAHDLHAQGCAIEHEGLLEPESRVVRRLPAQLRDAWHQMLSSLQSRAKQKGQTFDRHGLGEEIPLRD